MQVRCGTSTTTVEAQTKESAPRCIVCQRDMQGARCDWTMGQMASRRRQRTSDRKVNAFGRLALSNRRDGARKKNYRLSHRDVSGGRCGIVIKPTRQASAIGRVYRRPSLMVGGRHEQASPIARWSSTSLFVRISSCSFFPACNLSRTIQLSI